MSEQKTEMKSTQDLINEFEQSISSSSQRINDFVRRNNEGWGQVSAITEQIKGLIEQLKSCLDKLIGLKDFYLEFLGRLRTLRGRQEERLSGEMRRLQESGDSACKEKIQGLLGQFRTFISSFNQLEVGTTAQLREQVQRLDSEIKRLCNDTDGIIKQMENTRGEMDGVFGAEAASAPASAPRAADPRMSGFNRRESRGMVVPNRELRRPIRTAPRRPSLEERPAWRGGFQYGKKLKKKKKIRSLSSLKKKKTKKKSIFNKKKNYKKKGKKTKKRRK
jgi:hypothetical protein